MLDLAGHANGVALLFAGATTGPDLPLPGVDFPAVLAPAASVALGAPVLDGAGAATRSVPVPDDPSLAGAVAYFQFLELAGLEFAFSNPVAASVR